MCLIFSLNDSFDAVTNVYLLGSAGAAELCYLHVADETNGTNFISGPVFPISKLSSISQTIHRAGRIHHGVISSDY